MSWTETLQNEVDDIFGTNFDERDGRVVPTSQDVGNSQAVKLDATFLYADLAASAKLAKTCPWSTTAKVIRAYLSCSTRLIRAWGGEIRSFDGDRVMGVFVGDTKNTYAVRCAREIFYTTDQILAPKATKNFKSIRDADIKIRCCVGVDTGDSRAVRAGIRSSNDLIWIGRPPSMAAKLSDIREYPYCVYIHKDAYNKLPESDKIFNGANIWEKRNFVFAGETHSAYRTKFYKTP
jgi:class 3 adenylate cyclase